MFLLPLLCCAVLGKAWDSPVLHGSVGFWHCSAIQGFALPTNYLCATSVSLCIYESYNIVLGCHCILMSSILYCYQKVDSAAPVDCSFLSTVSYHIFTQIVRLICALVMFTRVPWLQIFRFTTDMLVEVLRKIKIRHTFSKMFQPYQRPSVNALYIMICYRIN